MKLICALALAAALTIVAVADACGGLRGGLRARGVRGARGACGMAAVQSSGSYSLRIRERGSGSMRAPFVAPAPAKAWK